jgi:uncharacterized repeat protein (TIGR02543 family)
MTASTWTSVNTNFIGIAGFRITPANGNMIGVDDIFIQNPRLVGSSTYTATYDSQSGSAVASTTGISSGTTITEPTAPTRTGYTFGGWYKESTCTNQWNFVSDTVTGNITLYAKWTAVSTTYTVTYDGNGNTGGTVPTDSTSYTTGQAVTVLANTGSLVKTGYTFAGWNTVADGSGTDYAAGSGIFNIAANTRLYAKWTQIPTTSKYTITINGNVYIYIYSPFNA